ncbi:hypothetical protein [Xylanimonas ulmi]|uniref:hypothetical protein n=1 Tax=Xylanimonas ulmi TaxID=228973 RepID=UPI00102D065C|nr:hypothetical protein [Xylanibacterium ulmi]
MAEVERVFPFSPRSSRSLRVGDLIGVPLEDGSWACLQVTVLLPSGPGSASSFVVTPLPWRGQSPPVEATVAGVVPTEHGLTHIDLFRKAGLAVTGWAPVEGDSAPRYDQDAPVGTRHLVWGYRTAIQRAMDAAGSSPER